MKSVVCILFLAALGSCAVAARRELHASVSASATARSTGAGSARVVATGSATGDETTTVDVDATAKGCGADATTVGVATGGADVDASTTAESVDCAPVSAETTAVGVGDVKVEANTAVKSDEPVNVAVYTQRVEGGENITVIAIELVEEFKLYTNASIVKTLLNLAADSKTLSLFDACIGLLYAEYPCVDFKLIVAGYERELVVYKLTKVIVDCIYTPCSNYDSSKSCCGKAQLEQDYCACADGKCGWNQPSPRDGYVPYWICNDCGHDTDFCICP